MKIAFIEIQNYRRLKSVRIDFSDTKTLFVGANNSGKTSAMDALISFLTKRSPINTNDFTLTNWKTINEIGESWEKLSEDDEDRLIDIDLWRGALPTLDLWLDVSDKELHHVSTFLPTLSWSGGKVGIRLSFEPKDISHLQKDYLKELKTIKDTIKQAPPESKDIRLWPNSLKEYLEKKLKNYFNVQYYTLDPQKISKLENGNVIPQDLHGKQSPLESAPLSGLIKIDSINAQRGFGDANDQEQETTGSIKKLSNQLVKYYNKHLNPLASPSPNDLAAIKAMQTAQEAFDETLKVNFKGVVDELGKLGYPGIADPNITLASKIDPMDGLKHDAAVQYALRSLDDKESFSLPETYNGLGYQNLISIFFNLMRFRDEWMKVGKASTDTDSDEHEWPPLHLVLIEEPEAHLHAQVQQVFIREAYNILRGHSHLKDNKTLSTQMIVSTHSSHIAHEVEFACLRYFRRLPATVNSLSIPTTNVINLTDVFGSSRNTARFATRYLKTTHCDLFFADAAILVEGSAERMLLPHFLENEFTSLNQRYVSLLEIGGAHAHRLRRLIEKMCLTTLIITDLDAAELTADKKLIKTIPNTGKGFKTRNTTLRGWVPRIKDLDKVIKLTDVEKTKVYDETFSVYAAYQVPEKITLPKNGLAIEVISNTFEDALVYQNIDFFNSTTETGFFKKAKEALESAENKEDLLSKMQLAINDADKAKFALDLLYLKDPKEITAPTYIKSGLSWLESQICQKEEIHIPIANDSVAIGGK